MPRSRGRRPPAREKAAVDPKLLTPLLFTALFVWLVYRRVKRTIGRQRFRPRALRIRIGILGTIGALLLWGLHGDPLMTGTMLAGAAAGTALGFLGLRHTDFETLPAGRFYTPHTYIGLLVVALFLGRIVYRVASLYLAGHAAAASPNPFAGYQQSPLTVGIFGTLVGYYLLYNAGILRRFGGEPPGTPRTPAS
jgi:hypothetical protein